MRDHPRICGEHIKYAVEGATSQGSSPHMRGTPKEGVYGKAVDGIIPAYAGNTRFHALNAVKMRDHPRICGEHT